MSVSFSISKIGRNRGETIIEVLVSVVILALVMTATFLLLQRAVAVNEDVRNRIIGLNIAREGLEGVRNIRDTNWLKYSGDRRGKWLCLDSTGTPDACGASVGTDALWDDNPNPHYKLEFDITAQRYYLVLSGTNAELDLEDTGTNFSDYQLYREGERYTHEATDGGGSNNEATQFHRQIEIDIQSPYNDIGVPPAFCTSSADCNQARVKVTSRVQWVEQSGETYGKSTLEHYLYDFFERDSY